MDKREVLMRFDMKLAEVPFISVKNGNKSAELRLNDEKRNGIKKDDMIFFHSLDNEYDVIKCRVKEVIHGKDFYDLYQKLSMEEIGYRKDEKTDPEDMYEYYSREQIERYGVLAIRFEKLDEPYLMDGHMHLEYGPLSREYAMAFVEEAVRKGLDEIDILDHSHRFTEFEPYYEHLRKYPQQDAWLKSEVNFNSSLSDYRALIEEMKKEDLPIRVKFGLEVCYAKQNEDFLRDVLKGCDFDFLTGAIHSIDGILYDASFSREILWDIKDPDEIFRRYYEEVLSLIRSGLFGRLAHPDQIKMMNIYPSYDLEETFEQIALALNEKGMYAENNSGIAYRYGHKDIGISDEMLEIFRKHHVKMITAADAHKPEHVGTLIREVTMRNLGGLR